MEYKTIKADTNGNTATVTLARPETHNAFDEVMVAEIHHCFSSLAGNPQTRIIVLTGEGTSFCAGANLNWMKSMADYTREQNMEDSRRLADMFETIYSCPKPVIGRINGSAFGGGLGLMAVCDHVVSVPEAVFSFSEVKLGIAPAVISPYILQKIPPGKARYLFLSGERFSPEYAMRIGLVDEIAAPENMDEAVKKKIKIISSSGPEAVGRNKELVSRVMDMGWDEARQYTIELIAELRTSPEGQEGIGAFLEKRKPLWIQRGE